MTNLTTQAESNVTENRNIYVGGSDVPVILGLSNFKTQYQLALEKTGIVKSKFKGNEYTQFGNALEPQIREYINLTTDYQFVETTSIDEERKIRSNTDGVDREEKVLLEIKTHGKTPTYQIYNAQMQLYMFQNDLDKGLLALYERPEDFDVEFDSERLQLNNVVRNKKFINEILEEIKLFWKRVEWLKNNPGASEYDYNNSLLNESESEEMVNELAVKTTEMTLPKIEFNYDELAANLEENLKKYEGLTFTESTAKDCRATITELNKGKRLVDEYRLKTKKQLLAPVEEFEDKCKALNKKFDEVISPLKEQADKFEEKRKNEKEKEVNELVMKSIEEHGFDVDFQQLIEFDPKWLNKSTSMKKIQEDIDSQIEQIKLQQQQEQLGKDLIKSHVELMNAKNDVELLETSYVHLAGNTETDEIKRLIEQDAETLVKRREKQKQLEKERLEQEHKQREEQEAKQQVKATTNEEEPSQDESLFYEVYKVTATESQLDALENFMRDENIQFEIEEPDHE